MRKYEKVETIFTFKGFFRSEEIEEKNFTEDLIRKVKVLVYEHGMTDNANGNASASEREGERGREKE